jgi:hypothetical protein
VIICRSRKGIREQKVREIMIYTANIKLSLVQLVLVRYSSVDYSVSSCTNIRPKICSVDEDARSELYWGAFAPFSVLDVAKELHTEVH